MPRKGLSDLFSQDYQSARQRFRKFALDSGLQLESHLIEADKSEPVIDLSMDVARTGAASSSQSNPTLVITSGVHGVEGFLGSAVQLALLQQLEPLRHQGVQLVLIHAVNPYGFHHLRRVNEDNVDLNRNFLSCPEDFHGAPEGCHQLNAFLNPTTPPLRVEFFPLQAVGYLFRYGMPALTQSIVGGQYAYPRGLFFGGHGLSRSTEIVQQKYLEWIGNSERVLHLDFHSGLGKHGHYKLLTHESSGSVQLKWYQRAFGCEWVEGVDIQHGTAKYFASGSIGEWLHQACQHVEFRFATVEFGTYGVVRMLKALRAENRAHQCLTNHAAPGFQRAKQELLECFCPSSSSWRDQVLRKGLAVIHQGVEALLA